MTSNPSSYSNKTRQNLSNIQNKIQLMTYPDSLGGDLKNLKIVLDTYLSRAISFVHILPPYPSSSDRGFAPLTHLKIEPKWGDWEDIQNISKDFGLMLDVIAGHISTDSEYFLDYLKNAEKSEFYEMFMRVEKTFKDEVIKISELEKFGYLTPIPPLILFKLENGKCKLHFKTFMATQADLDPNSEITRKILTEFIQNHAKMGVKMIRLDAVETICKDRDLGYHLVPETFEVMQWLIDTVKASGMEVLCEVFGEEELKEKIVKMGAWIYDFNLPDIVLHSIFSQNTQHLKTWFGRQVSNTITVLTNHDGFMTGRILQTLSLDEAEFTRKNILENGGSLTQKASGTVANNIASDGINATLIEALHKDQEKWLIANILHLFAPGIPQVYYNDLLAQTNDLEMFKEVGEGRSLIRHNFDMEELEQGFTIPYVEKLIKIMEFRNNFSAFNGQNKVEESDESMFVMTWENNGFLTRLTINLVQFSFNIEYKKPNSEIKTWSFEEHNLEEIL